MPHKALVNSEEVKSWRFSKEEWKALRTAQASGQIKVNFSCCNARVILRAGSRRQHFAHYRIPEHCNYKPKSPEHQDLQSLIAQTCEEAGWEADIEVSGPGYEADVLAIKEGLKVTFEVQLSYQTLEKTMERRQVFKADNVKDYWLFKRLPATKISEKLYRRLYLLKQEGHDYYIQYPKSRKGLASFVKQVLMGAGREPDKDEAEPIKAAYYNHIPTIPNPGTEFLRVLVGAGVLVAAYGILYTMLKAIFTPKRK